MGKVLTFSDFSKRNPSTKAENSNSASEGHMPDSDLKHYMFFQNLATIKHYLEEIMTMDKNKIDGLLSAGHDWAVDHLSTSTDDIAEVTNWLRGEIEMGGEEKVDQIIATLDGTETIPNELLTGDEEEVEKTELEMIDDEKGEKEDEDEDEGDEE